MESRKIDGRQNEVQTVLDNEEDGPRHMVPNFRGERNCSDERNSQEKNIVRGSWNNQMGTERRNGWSYHISVADYEGDFDWGHDVNLPNVSGSGV